MSRLLKWLADRLILSPTRHRIDVDNQSRLEIGSGPLEVWIPRTVDGDDAPPDACVLKFPGTASRAELATDHPANAWPELRVAVWAVNLPGYGGSGGQASLRNIASTADTVWRALQDRYPGCPVVVTGNSLGCVSGLYLTAHYPVAGLVLRNPPALREVIIGRFGRWSLGIGARLIARQIPASLCSIANARRSSAPAIFLTAKQDRIVPARFQQQIFDAYAGPKWQLLLDDADHATPLTDAQAEQYAAALVQLRSTMAVRFPRLNVVR